MSLSDHDLRALWRERSTLTTTEQVECLTSADWTRLLSGEADERERLRLATHIASCASCADEYRLLEPFKAWMADVEQVVSPSRGTHGDRWRAWWAWPQLAQVAASLLLVTLGVVSFLLVSDRRAKTQLEAKLAENTRRLSSSEASFDALQGRLRREISEKEQLATSERQRLAQMTTPHLDTAIVDLKPQIAGAVRGASDPPLVTTAADALTMTLVLNFPPLSSRSTLEVDVADANGQSRWTGRSEQNQDTAILTLALPTAGYPAGRYVIRLFDVTRGRTLLATYPVVIRLADGRTR